MEEDAKQAIQEAINKHDAAFKQRESEYNANIQNYQNEISALKKEHESAISVLNTEIEGLKKKSVEGNFTIMKEIANLFEDEEAKAKLKKLSTDLVVFWKLQFDLMRL